MTTFKHGDFVTCTIQGTEITDARISINKDGYPFICQNEKAGGIVDDRLGYKYSWCLYKDFTDEEVTNLNLKLKERTIRDVQVGDVIVSKYEDEYTVLMRSGDVVVLGFKQNYGFSTSVNLSIDEIVHKGYTLKQPTPEPEVKEMTVKEVSEKLGYTVKIVE